METKTNRFAARYNDINENKDFYPTPSYATECLMKREMFDGFIWEPACGDGAISKIVEKYNTNIDSSDLIERGYGNFGVDFLTTNPLRKYNHIITNPPYKYAEDFIEKSLKIVDGKIDMLLRLSFLESQGRFKLFTETPLKCVYVFSKRLEIYKNGVKGNSGMVGYAWYVWDKSYKGKPYLEWIND